MNETQYNELLTGGLYNRWEMAALHIEMSLGAKDILIKEGMGKTLKLLGVTSSDMKEYLRLRIQHLQEIERMMDLP